MPKNMKQKTAFVLSQAIVFSCKCLIIFLLSCSDKSTKNISTSSSNDINSLPTYDSISIDESQYYDYNDEFIFVETIWDSSKYYSVKLCDCMVNEIIKFGYPVNGLLERYWRAMRLVHGVSESEVFLCTYLREWGGVYDRRIIDSIIENHILLEDNILIELIESYKTNFGLVKTLDIVTQYELNCKIIAPYTRMTLNLDLEKIGKYVCILKNTDLDYCVESILGNVKYWYYDEDIRVIKAYIDKHCD
jgi:hypothetical protein